MRLNQISDFRSAKKKRVRVGRGVGSGLGKTCGSGQKGQKSRSGVAIKGFEGGQMPLYRRLPKRGFKKVKSKYDHSLNLKDIQNFIDNGRINAEQPITLELLKNAFIISPKVKNLKLLSGGEIKNALTIELKNISKSAKSAIEHLGGKVIFV